MINTGPGTPNIPEKAEKGTTIASSSNKKYPVTSIPYITKKQAEAWPLIGEQVS